MLQNLLASLDMSIDILILSETWLKPHNIDVYSLIGYKHEYLIRNSKPGGGLSIYIKENINYSTRDDLQYQSDDIEMLWIELEKGDSFFEKNLVIGGMYAVQAQTQTLLLTSYTITYN